MGKKYTADTFEGAVTGTASGNVAKSGDTMTGALTNTSGDVKTVIGGGDMLSFEADSGAVNNKIRVKRNGSGGPQAYIGFEEVAAAYTSNKMIFNLVTPGTYTENDFLTLQDSNFSSSDIFIRAHKKIIADDGIYLGTTSQYSSANHLDDYEEGTWTPSLYNSYGIGVTYYTQSAEYIKVGRIVHIKGLIEINAMSYSPGGTMGINVPFSVDQSNGIAYGIFQPIQNLFVTNGSNSNFKDTYNVKLKFQGTQAPSQCRFSIPSSVWGATSTDATGSFMPAGTVNNASFGFSAVYTSTQ